MASVSRLGAAHWVRVKPAVAPLAVGILVLLLVFHTEVLAALKIWVQSSAYGHCFLVLPLALWLAYERRDVVLGLAVTPLSPRIVIWCLPLIAFWVVSYVLGIMEGRQLAAMGFLQLLLLAVLGRDLYLDFSPALLFLIFLVPFGAFATPVLQHFTAAFIDAGLTWLHIPHVSDSFRIEIPEGTFYVAEACAGLRFLIASMAFGVLYSVTMFRTPARRIGFMIASAVVPVFANGVRGLGIVVLGHIIGSAQAAAADHLIYGWVFFTAVTFALALAGLPYREDLQIEVAPRSVADFARGATLPPMRMSLADFASGRNPQVARSAWPAALALAGMSIFGPGVGYWLDHRTPNLAVAIVPEASIPGDCSAGASKVTGAISVQHFTCPDAKFTLTVAAFGRGTNPARVIGEVRDIAQQKLLADVDQSVMDVSGAHPENWVTISENKGNRASALVWWLDGKPALGGIGDRIELAQSMLHGGALRPPLGVVITIDADRAIRDQRLRDFIAAQDQLPEQIKAQLDAMGE